MLNVLIYPENFNTKIMYRYLLFFIALSLNALLIAQPLSIGPEKIKSLDSLFRISFPTSDPGAIIIVAQGGRPVFKKAYGMANLENNILLNTDHKMGIGSISKQFAAISILLCYLHIFYIFTLFKLFTR